MSHPTPLTSYDEVPYPNISHRESQPDRLATLATLFGMDPAPIERCRVLELGCASGGNLIPIALTLPESHFVGLDYAARQIESGQALVKQLGLQNVELHHLSILDIEPEFGKFDYIIAHGVYSWVPPEVQEKILAICRHNLAPNGVAFVSYNTYPGWHMLEMAREMMLYHTREMEEPHARAQAAREMISFVAEGAPPQQQGYASFLKTYAALRKQQQGEEQDDARSFLIHDDLSEHNSPLYFHQFAQRLEAHDLQYLAEAEFAVMLPFNFPAEVAQRLGEFASSQIEMEQYMDFLYNRSFRKTLICHREVELNRNVQATPEALAPFVIASQARPASETPDIQGRTVEQFRIQEGAALTSDHPVTKAAMCHLQAIAPQGIRFDTLLAEASAQVYGTAGPSPAQAREDAQLLATSLLRGFSYHTSLVELHCYLPAFVTEASERPLASPYARLQGQERTIVTNLRHERVTLDPFTRHLLPLLDGNHTREQLLAEFMARARNEEVAFTYQGQPIHEENKRQEIASQQLEISLRFLAEAALLLA